MRGLLDPDVIDALLGVPEEAWFDEDEGGEASFDEDEGEGAVGEQG